MLALPTADQAAAWRSYLQPGERLLWVGRPASGLMFQRSDIFLIPFGFFWAGGVLSIVPGPTEHAPFPFALFPIIFIVVAFYVTIGRFLVDMWIRSRIVYAVTNHRVLSLRVLGGINLKAQDIDNLNSFDLYERSNGRGTIDFDTMAFSMWSRQGQGVSPALKPGLRFLGIPDVRAIYNLISQQQQRHR